MSRQTLDTISCRFWLLSCIAATVIMAAAVTVQTQSVFSGVYTGTEYRYSDSTLPMLRNLDGYRFLREAHEVESGSYARWDTFRNSPRSYPPPLLSCVMAVLSGAGMELKVVALWLPPVLGMLSILGYIVWAYVFRAPLLVPAAALFHALSPYWIERSSVGRLDTDCLIPLFSLLVLYFSHQLSSTIGRVKLYHAFGLLLCTVLFGWWWPPGFFVGLAGGVLYCVDVLHSSERRERMVKISLLSVLVAIAFVPAEFLPAVVGGAKKYALKHALLALQGQVSSVAASIEELSGVAATRYADVLAGGLLPFLVVCVGLLLLVRKHREAAFYLAPMLVAGGAALASQRFLILTLPLASLGFGYCIQAACGHFPWRNLRDLSVIKVGLAGLATCAVGSLLLYSGYTPDKPRIGNAEYSIVTSLQKTDPDSVVWSWWDYGYFIQREGGRATFIDGGRQSDLATYVSAVPLIADNNLFARNWIRFFALKGESQLLYLTDVLGGKDKATAFLRDVFSQYSSATFPEKRFAIPGWPDIRQRLFPEGDVYLYLPTSFLEYSGYWYALGHEDAGKIPIANHVDVFAKKGFSYAPSENKVYLPEEMINKGYSSLGAVISLDGVTNLSQSVDGLADPYLFYSSQSALLYVADKPIVSTLAFRLLVTGGLPVEGFNVVRYDANRGGVWQVLP